MCDLDPKVKVGGKKAGICDSVPSTAALVSYFKYPRTNKIVKILGMSLRLKKVCQVYNTYPITELKMHRLIQWNMCVYKGVKVWSFRLSNLLLSVNN